jgi:hypothetical protein
MPNYNFNKDLPVAIETEKEVAQILAKIYSAEILKFEHSNKYDILARIKNNDYKFEVKDDYLSEKTGNIAIEYFSRNKPSGISTTQADYYVYKINISNGENYCYIIKVSKLKEIIKNNLFFRIVDGGDSGSHTLCYLFKENVFSKHARKLNMK